jgi:ABC-type nitrate/sulfonate/bicarbonate transport system permease component
MRAMLRRWLLETRMPGLVLIVLLLAVWQISATWWVDSPTWPPVTRILESWWANTIDGTLPTHFLATLWRQMLGYVLATVLGIGLGLIMGYYRAAFNTLEPLIEVLRPIPGPAYLPVLVLFIGIGDEMKVVLILVGAFFPVLLNTYSGVRAIDRVQFDTARTLGLTPFQTFRELIVPAASPQILTGMRISLAISLILAVLGEMIVSNDGLGYFTLLAERTFQLPNMYAGIFTLALFGYVVNRIFLWVEGRLIRWHSESSGRT